MSAINDGGFYTIGDETFSVSTTAWAATLARVMVPDRNGKMANVTAGFDKASSYAPGGQGGIVMCPNAGRIMGGLPIDGKVYDLVPTYGEIQMHGGPNAVKHWEVEAYDETMVRYTASQPDGLDGWPGNRTYWVTYSIDLEKKMFRLCMEAVSDKPTYVNMGSHAYWNMSGDFTKSAREQYLKLRCSYAYTNDDRNVAETKIDVTGTPYDYRQSTRIQDYFDNSDHPEFLKRHGYDNAFVLDHDSDTEPDIEFYDPESGRRMCIKTDAPAAVIFSGGSRPFPWVLRGGVSPVAGSMVAFECHDIPNTPNKPELGNHLLMPGEKFVRTVDYYFDVK